MGRRLSDRTCTVPGCSRKHKAKGLCDKHYQSIYYRSMAETSETRQGKPSVFRRYTGLPSILARRGDIVQVHGRRFRNLFVWDYHPQEGLLELRSYAKLGLAGSKPEIVFVVPTVSCVEVLQRNPLGTPVNLFLQCSDPNLPTDQTKEVFN